MSTSSWGNFPSVESRPSTFNHKLDFSEPLIARGNGRSYGDSALANQMINMRTHNLLLSFNDNTGIVHCQSGALLSELIEVFLPEGWFPLVTPGTKFITIGGAIASDVHGKNHHLVGSFSESIIEFNILLPSTEIITCSPTSNSEFFHASIGGMGLTGIILDAKIQLQKVNSQHIDQTTIKTKNLKDTFDQFEKYKTSSYSVAWIDCLARNKNIGKGIITLGEHANDNDLTYISKEKFSLPFFIPAFSLNQFTLKAFNTLYYLRAKQGISKQKVSIDSFFYPLDGIENWNRVYGKNGFIQYQFVLPLENGYQGMYDILSEISKAGTGSPLVVLKLMGEQNQNLLSFPRSGYTLALDFKNNDRTKNLLKKLDNMVLKYGGRFYLAKDSRIEKDGFEQGYPDIGKFRAFRQQNKLDKHFTSLQSQRLSL
jgi:FAD/FMN-containing dehydrogenase